MIKLGIDVQLLVYYISINNLIFIYYYYYYCDMWLKVTMNQRQLKLLAHAQKICETASCGTELTSQFK